MISGVKRRKLSVRLLRGWCNKSRFAEEDRYLAGRTFSNRYLAAAPAGATARHSIFRTPAKVE